MVYRLDAVDAYERKLVKQIEVAAAAVEDRAQQALRAAARRQFKQGTVTAKVELDVETPAGAVHRRDADGSS